VDVRSPAEVAAAVVLQDTKDKNIKEKNTLL